MHGLWAVMLVFFHCSSEAWLKGRIYKTNQQSLQPLDLSAKWIKNLYCCLILSFAKLESMKLIPNNIHKYLAKTKPKHNTQIIINSQNCVPLSLYNPNYFSGGRRCISSPCLIVLMVDNLNLPAKYYWDNISEARIHRNEV